MRLITITLVLAALLLISAQANAKDNFCAECHTSMEIAAFGNVMEWDKSVFQARETLCPGVLELKKEAFFAESRMVKYDEFLTELEHTTRRYPEYMREDLVKQGVKYEELASMTPSSIGGIAGPNLKVKKGMHGVYETLNKLRGDFGLEKVMGYSLLGTMIVSLLFAFGLKNTLKE
jgi:hypothetical protein